MVLTAVACGLLLQSEPRITYSTTGQPMEQAFLELSKQAGYKLYVSTELRDEPLILRFKDVPINEGLAKIAKAASAEWESLPQG